MFRLTRASLTANYSLSSRDLSGESSENSGNGNQVTPDVLGKNLNPANSLASNSSSSQNNEEEIKNLIISKLFNLFFQ